MLQIYSEEPIKSISKGYSNSIFKLRSFHWVDSWSSNGCTKYAGLHLYFLSTPFSAVSNERIINLSHSFLQFFIKKGYGKYLWIMQGMFRANGGCGYVKKPDFLLNICSNNEVSDPSIRRQVKNTLKVCSKNIQ